MYYNELRKVVHAEFAAAKKHKKERQAAGDYARPGEDTHEKLVVEGRPAVLYKDPKKTAAAAAEAALVPCHGRQDILVDRFGAANTRFFVVFTRNLLALCASRPQAQ